VFYFGIDKGMDQIRAIGRSVLFLYEFS